MMLIKRSSTNPLNLNRFFDDFNTRDIFDWNSRNHSSVNSSMPAVNIEETKDEYRLEMAAPGMDKKDFRIELDNETLTISVEKEIKNEETEDGKMIRREFGYSSFKRTFQLAKEVVDESKIQAKYNDGILRVLIPKKEEVKALPPRTIKIS